MSDCRCSRASRYCGNVSQFQGTPAAITTSGMSSTPSISVMRAWRCSSRAGAKPTPQLPITTLVTPWPDEGASRFSQVI